MSAGMEQGEARRWAKRLGGIAVSARPKTGEKWQTGGWPEPKDVWIVTDPWRREVLYDGTPELAAAIELPDRPVGEEEAAVLRLLVRKGGSAGPRHRPVWSEELVQRMAGSGLIDLEGGSVVRITAKGLAAYASHGARDLGC